MASSPKLNLYCFVLTSFYKVDYSCPFEYKQLDDYTSYPIISIFSPEIKFEGIKWQNNINILKIKVLS